MILAAEALIDHPNFGYKKVESLKNLWADFQEFEGKQINELLKKIGTEGLGTYAYYIL